MAHALLSIRELPVADFNFDARDEIGDGRFSRVYTVPCKGSRVAVKVPHSRRSPGEALEILDRIRHRNIVTFFGTVAFDNRTCCVFEFAQNGSLEGIISGEQKSSCRCDLDVKRRWTIDIASGLSYLHHDIDPPVCHGDLKASNVLIYSVREDMTVAKIADFGLAREMFDSASVISPGTLLWAAPELLRRETHSLMSDVWSFGVTITEIFSWKPPYEHLRERKKENEILRDVQDGLIDPLTEMPLALLSEFPQNISKILRSCFVRERNNRLTMKKLLRDLTDETVTEPQRPKEKPRDRRIHVTAWNPHGDWQGKSFDVVERENLREFLHRIGSQFRSVPTSKRPSVNTNEILYGPQGSRKTALKCLDETKNRFLHVDSETGEEVPFTSCSFIIRRYIQATSQLPTSPCFTPGLIVETHTEFFQVRNNRLLQVAPDDALIDPVFVVFIWGVKCGPKYFWRVAGGDFFDGESGAVYRDHRTIPGAGKRSYVICLLRRGDRPPKIAVPQGKFLEIFFRNGCGVRMEDGKLTAGEAYDLESWMTPYEIDALDQNFTTAAREK